MTTLNKTDTIEILHILYHNGLLHETDGDMKAKSVFPLDPKVLSLFTFSSQSVEPEKCCARVATGSQCTKKRQNGDFCKSHARRLEECKPCKNWRKEDPQSNKCKGCSNHAGFTVAHEFFWEHCGRIDTDVAPWHWMKTGKGFNIQNYLCFEADAIDERVNQCWNTTCSTCGHNCTASSTCDCDCDSDEDIP